MKIQCPYCNAEVELPESSVSRHLLPCPVCRKKFLAVGELTFRYGISLPKNEPAGPERVECPYCSQHYNVNFTPRNGMLGCVKCLKVFAVPPASSLQTINLTAANMGSGNRLAPNRGDTSSVRPYPPPSSKQNPVPQPEPAASPASVPVVSIAPETVEPAAFIRPDAVTVADVMISRPAPFSSAPVQPESLGIVRVVPEQEAEPAPENKPVPLQSPTGSFRLVRPEDVQEN